MSNKVLTYLKLAVDDSVTQLVIGDTDYEQVFSAGSEGDLYLILRGPINREIVKVDLESSLWGSYITVARGEGGTSAFDWPQGSKVLGSTHADLYNALMQAGDNRTIDYNPNEVLSPLFAGEKVYQSEPAGCERWWKSLNGVDPYWDIITGEPCGSEIYIDGILKEWDPSLVLIDTNAEGGSDYGGMASNGTYLIASCGYDGIRSFWISDAGFLFFDKIHDQGGDYVDVIYDGTFFYALQADKGMLSYSVDGNGDFTLLDVYNTVGNSFRGLYHDGTFLYLAATGSKGLMVWEVDGAGQFGIKDKDTAIADFRDVWGDGTRVFATCYNLGLRSYTVDANGVLTLKDQIDVESSIYYGVWCDGTFIYVAGYLAGLLVYSVDENGILAYESAVNDAARYLDVWGDGTYIYAAGRYDGILVYTVDGNGDLTLETSVDPGWAYYDIAGDGKFIYGSISENGIRSHEIIYT